MFFLQKLYELIIVANHFDYRNYYVRIANSIKNNAINALKNVLHMYFVIYLGNFTRSSRTANKKK